ncbi:hypothetical protein Taro_019668 [Colocasia esculenta]|uniref:Uncharacterized protein n=1 Tax=Colocasia esculenta TaxID=4460 RepID=A0A843V2W7_COLES|nr:hypothetical protein [Colocasia esculenta]
MTNVQTLFAKEVSTHPTMVSTQQPRFKGKKTTQVDALSRQVNTGLSSQNSMFAELGQQVDAGPEQVDTGISSQNSMFAELGQQVDTASEQVNTGPCCQNSLFSIWDSVSTPPPGRVDTLRKDCNLNWMSTQHQSRSTLDLVPRTACSQFGTVCRHHHQGRSTHYEKIAT